MNGTKLPNAIKELSDRKEITLFVDGDRGGKLIAQNVMDNAKVRWIAVAPDGKEVEELTGKEIIMNLRKRVPAGEFFSRFSRNDNDYRDNYKKRERIVEGPTVIEKIELNDDDKKKLKKISSEIQGSDKAVLLDRELNDIKRVSVKSLSNALRKVNEKPIIIVMDGTVTRSVVEASEDSGIQIIVAKNFSTTDTQIELMSL
jgi:DNA primase